jgi:hypothetical protein
MNFLTFMELPYKLKNSITNNIIILLYFSYG